MIRELGIDEERVNVNGGAIAIGHPLGMSGARLVVTLLHELRRRGARYGVATMCVGVGQGQAALFERMTRRRALPPARTAPRPACDGLVDSYYGPAELQEQSKPRSRSTRRSSRPTRDALLRRARTAGSTAR